MAQSQRIFYVQQATIVVDHCTPHEQNQLSHLRYIIRNIHNLWNNEYKCYILAQSQGTCIFYIHQAPIVVDYCTKYEQNQTFQFKYHNKHIQCMKNSHNYSNLAWSQMLFYIMSNTWYPITVPQIKSTHSSQISQQTHKTYEKVAIIIQIWHRAKWYLTSMGNTWCLITIPDLIKITTFFSEIS